MRGPFLGIPKATILIFSLERDRFPREASARKLPPETGLAAEGRAGCAVLTPWGQAPGVAPRPPTMQMRGPQDSAASQAASASLDSARCESFTNPDTQRTVSPWSSPRAQGPSPPVHLPPCFQTRVTSKLPFPVSAQMSFPLCHEASGGSEIRCMDSTHISVQTDPPNYLPFGEKFLNLHSTKKLRGFQ